MSVVQLALSCAIDIIDIRMTSCVSYHDNMLLILLHYFELFRNKIFDIEIFESL